MPSTRPHLTVQAASLPADGKLGQDRHFIGEDFVIVLDGASSPVPDDRDGGWYADVLGADIQTRLVRSGSLDLRRVLAESIASITDRYQLLPGRSPSSTVAIARWDATHLHALVLGDSPLIAQANSGAILQLRDDRLAKVAQTERETYRAALRRGGGYGEAHRRHLRHVVQVERSYRNQPGGYWIAEATPNAARHAVHARLPLADLQLALLITDGVSCGVEQYHFPDTWPSAFDFISAQGLDHLLRAIYEIEAADRSGACWPRSKPHDDKTACLITRAT